jgi:hypothetical protein
MICVRPKGSDFAVFSGETRRAAENGNNRVKKSYPNEERAIVSRHKGGKICFIQIKIC